MTQEEKAKAYDEALEKARNLHKDAIDMGENIRAKQCEIIFPELKESEDEKIRKALLELVHDTTGDDLWIDYNVHKEDAIAWLEKQGKNDMGISEATKKKLEDNLNKALEKETPESWNKFLDEQDEQKPIDKIQLGKKYKCIASPRYSTFVEGLIYRPEDKFLCSLMNLCSDCFESIDDVEPKDYNSIDPHFGKPIDEIEPKFKVEKDKWYVCISQYCNCIEGRNYKVTSDGRIIDDYGTEYDMHSDAYKWFRPWTIKDAKDGDVLNSPSHHLIWIYRDNEHYYACVNLNYVTENVATDGLISIPNDACPATKEQREQLKKNND